MRAAARCAFGGEHFGDHAAAPDVAADTARHCFEFGVARLCCTDEGGAGILARVGGEEADLVGKDDQHIGFDQVGDECTQGVVVAEFDFVGNDGVIFVDDRNDAELEQGA